MTKAVEMSERLEVGNIVSPVEPTSLGTRGTIVAIEQANARSRRWARVRFDDAPEWAQGTPYFAEDALAKDKP